MRLLARFKGLRGTALDPFARSADRKLDLELLAAYERTVAEILVGLEAANYETAVALAALPEEIRGYGPVRHRHAEQAKKRQLALTEAFRRKENVATPAVLAKKTIAVLAG